MRAWIAQAFALVAFCSTAFPAFADTRQSSDNMVNTMCCSDRNSSSSGEYWVGRGGHSIAPGIRLIGDDRPDRNILLSGYHPVEGFAAEMAEERAARERAGR